MNGRRTSALTGVRWVTAIVISTALLSVIALAALAEGSSSLSMSRVLEGLISGGFTPIETTILMDARLPRVIFAALVGAALATGGVVFQAVLRNPLADPYILGISGGAALGGSIVLAVGVASFGVAAGAIVGAFVTIALIFGVAHWSPGGRSGTYVLLLTGVIFNAFAAAIIMFLKSVVSAQKAQELLFYLMGSLNVESVSTHETFAVGLGVLCALVGLFWFARDLDLMTLGDDEAAALGVDVDRVRWKTVVIASVAVAISVAYTGLIGFVGLIVPHALRLFLGPDHRLLLPVSALIGAAFLIFCDLLSRLFFPVFSTALPVGVVTAFVGGPLFFYFLRRALMEGGTS